MLTCEQGILGYRCSLSSHKHGIFRDILQQTNNILAIALSWMESLIVFTYFSSVIVTLELGLGKGKWGELIGLEKKSENNHYNPYLYINIFLMNIAHKIYPSRSRVIRLIKRWAKSYAAQHLSMFHYGQIMTSYLDDFSWIQFMKCVTPSIIIT